jgi:hypothetical protein
LRRSWRIANATATVRTMLKPMRLIALRKSVISVSVRRNSAEFAIRRRRAASAGSELRIRTMSPVSVSEDCRAR